MKKFFAISALSLATTTILASSALAEQSVTAEQTAPAVAAKPVTPTVPVTTPAPAKTEAAPAVTPVSGSAKPAAAPVKPKTATIEVTPAKTAQEASKAEKAETAENPSVLAKVNGIEISKKDVDTALSTITMAESGGKPSFDKLPPDFQKAFLDRYIEKMLTIEAAKKAGLQNDPEVKQKLKDAEEYLIQQKFLSSLVTKQITEDKLKKLYDEKAKKASGKEEIHALHILVKTEEEAKKVREEVTKAGADFEKTAKEKSIEPGAKVSGGDLGYFAPDQMVPQFSDAVNKMKAGEISQPVKSPFGWHIIKLVDKRKKAVSSYAEMKPQLQNELASKIIAEEAKKLRDDAKIEYFTAPAKAAPKTAEADKTEKPVTKSNINQPAAPKAEAPKAAPAAPAQ